MSNRRTSPLPIPSAETFVLTLGLLALAGCLIVALLVPAPPLDPLTYLVWIVALTAALNFNITVESIEVNLSGFFLVAALLALGLGPALLIFVAALVVSETIYLLRRRRSDQPYHVRAALVSVGSNLTVDGLALLAGSVVFYALGGTVPFIPPLTNWIINLSIELLLQLLCLDIVYLFINFSTVGTILKLREIDVRPLVERHWREIAALGIAPILLSSALAVAALNMPIGVFGGTCLLLILSMYIAHNLSNARVRLERRVRELDSLSVIGQTVANSLELPEVLEAIHQQAMRLMDAGNFYIALYDESERRITFPLAYENDQHVTYTSRLFGDGFTEYIILSRQPLLITHDVQDFARRIGQENVDPQVRSWLGVPIAVGERVLGVMAVQSREQAHSYDESHRNILASIATQAAAAIRNSQMYMAVRRQTANLSIINSVLTAINSTLDLNQVLNIIVTSLPQVVGCQKAAIFLADDQGRTAQLAASHNFSPEFVARSQSIPISLTDRSMVIASGQALIVNNTHTDERTAPFRTAAETEGFRALADVPLQTQAHPIGSLTVYYTEPHQFTSVEIEELTTFANQAAVAVANARLYARTDQALTQRLEQLATLEQIGRDLTSSLDLDRIVHRLLDRAIAATDATQGSVGLWNAEQRTTQIMVTSGYEREEEARLRQGAWPVSLGLTGRAIRTGQSFFVADVRHDSDYAATNARILSEMVVLINKEDHILGVINLESPELGRFDQNALDFVSQLARQAAVALENAQLFRDAQSRLREMSILYTVGQQITSLLDLSRLGEELTRQMARALNTTYCALQLFATNTGRMHSIARYFSPYITHTPAALNIPGEYLLADYPGQRTAFEQRAIQIIYRNDPIADSADTEFLFRHDLHALLTAPLILRDEIIGAVEWGDERTDRRFSLDEERLAATLANQATIAVHNARLFEDRARRIHNLSQLYQASLVLTTKVEVEQVLNSVGIVARAITEADAVTLYLYDRPTDTFTRAYAGGVVGEWSAAHQLRRTGMTRRVIEQGLPLLVADTRTETDMNPATLAAGIRSLIAAPLISQGKTIGVLYVSSYEPQSFDADDTQIVSALANQAAVAIENARLFEERAQRIAALNQLYQASLALSVSVELEDVLQRIGTVAREISRADAASLYIYDEQTDSFTRAYAIGVTGDWSPAHLRSSGMTRRVMKEGTPVLVTETHDHPEVNPHTIEAGIRSLIAAPLLSQSKPVGVMYVGSFSAHQFDDSDVQLVSALANQAAVAISNARLFDEIAESRDRLQAILDSAADGILMFDTHLNVSMLNPNLENMWGISRTELIGHSLLELLDRPELNLAEKLGYTTERLRLFLEQLRAGQEVIWNKQVYALSDSSLTRYIDRSCLPVRETTPYPIGWMMVLRDVTEEIELQRMRDDLSHTIVHDLRSPLSSILGSLYFLEELSDPTKVESPEREALAISIRGANKLMNLVNSLLDIARLSSGQTLVEVQAERLEPVLDAAVESLWPLAQDIGITLTKQVEADLPLVLIDEDKINRVLINLIDNALKFTPRGGHITVVAERWNNGSDTSYVRCTVRDTGPGVPPEYRTRIFDRFVQLASRQGRRRGTGIGLNFCRLAVEAHGGKIWVEDAPGGGSQFSFTLQAIPD